MSPGTEDGQRSHPSPDHWLPLIYAYAAVDAQDSVEFPMEGFDMGLSMRSVLFAVAAAGASDASRLNA